MGAPKGTSTNWGGVAGDTLGGAASGAAIGAPGGPIGALVGGGIGAAAGFFTGLFSSNSPDPIVSPPPPPPPIEEGDEIAKRAEIAKQARLMASGAGNFLTGPLGAPASPGYAPRAGGK